MAPEQAGGQIREIGPATDIYALGTILYEMLTGRPPFRGPTLLETLEQVRTAESVPPSRLQPQLPRDLETICLKCLQKEPRQRYATALELANDLRRFRAGEAIKARPQGRRAQAWRWCRRNPARVALVALVALLLLGGLPGLLVLRLHLLETDFAIQQAHTEAVNLQRSNLLLQQQEQTARELAATEQYFSLLNKVRQGNLHKRPGWKTQGLEHLAVASGIATKARNRLDLRNEAVVGLAGVDVQLKRTLAKGSNWSWLTFTPDGRYLALAPHNPAFWLSCSIQLLDVATGQVRKQLTYHPAMAWQSQNGKPDGPRELAISPDGKWLAVGARSGHLHCWSLTQPKAPTISWQAHDGEITGLLFSSDSQALLSSSRNSVSRWPFHKGGKETSRYAHADKTVWIRALLPGPPGSLSVLAGIVTHDTLLQLDEVSLTKVRCQWEIPRSFWPLTVNKNSNLLLHCGPPDGRGLYLQELHADVDLWGKKASLVRRLPINQSREEDQVAHEGAVRSVVLSPDETLLASTADGLGDHTLKLWEMRQGQLLFTLQQGPTSGTNLRVAFSPDGKLLATTAPQHVNLYELSLPQVVRTQAQHGKNLAAARWLGATEEIACLSFFEKKGIFGELTLWRQGVQVARKPFSVPPFEEVSDISAPILAGPRSRRALAFINDPRSFYHLEDPRQSDNLRHIQIKRPRALSYAPNGQTLWGIAYPNDLVSWKLPQLAQHSRTQVIDLLLTGADQMVVLEAGNHWVLAGGRDGKVYLFRSNDGKLASYLPPLTGGVASLALNTTETLAACGSQQGTVRILQLPQGEVQTELTGPDSPVTALAFSEDGAYLASGAADGTIRLWHKQQDKYVLVVTFPETATIRFLQFCGQAQADLQLLALGDREQAVRIWNVARLRQQLSQMKLDW